jgi:hypothetical protein
MSQPSIEDIEAEVERASAVDSEEEEAAGLTAARSDLRRLREEGGADADRLDELEARIDERLRELSREDEYAADSLGAAMEPDEEDAP